MPETKLKMPETGYRKPDSGVRSERDLLLGWPLAPSPIRDPCPATRYLLRFGTGDRYPLSGIRYSVFGFAYSAILKMPRRMASAVAWARSLTSSFSRMWLT